MERGLRMAMPRSDLVAEGLASPSDAELVRRCRRDLEAFVDLYDRYVDDVYRYCRRRLPQDAAEDATSTAFLNAIGAVRALDPDKISSLRPWLFTIARNTITDQLRKRPHQPLDEIELAEPGPSLDDRAIESDRRRSLSRAIATLGAEQQQVIRLRLAGLHNPEIGEVMGKSPGAIRIIHHRAVTRLRQLLTDREHHALDRTEPT
jgi:RNA polymerase sigma-70 factor (ECF subfamily)